MSEGLRAVDPTSCCARDKLQDLVVKDLLPGIISDVFSMLSWSTCPDASK